MDEGAREEMGEATLSAVTLLRHGGGGWEEDQSKERLDRPMPAGETLAPGGYRARAVQLSCSGDSFTYCSLAKGDSRCGSSCHLPSDDVRGTAGGRGRLDTQREGTKWISIPCTLPGPLSP